jgi:hypothetical protein
MGGKSLLYAYDRCKYLDVPEEDITYLPRTACPDGNPRKRAAEMALAAAGETDLQAPTPLDSSRAQVKA